jgi:hypothetical protein
MYVSAHTHDSATARLHSHDSISKSPEIGQRRQFLEVNIGSVVSWPMEYSYLSLSLSRTSERIALTLSVASAARILREECSVWDKQEYRRTKRDWDYLYEVTAR